MIRGDLTYYWFDRPIPPSIRKAKHLRLLAARMILEGGTSHHSSMGITLPRMLEYLENARVPYTITATPGVGYTLVVEPKEKRFELPT